MSVPRSFPSLRLAAEEPDQVMRLARFRQDHPNVLIGGGGFGTWQARIPEPHGETVVTRYQLTQLLDKLDELVGQHQGQPGAGPG